jgi:hypothetical protein
LAVTNPLCPFAYPSQHKPNSSSNHQPSLPPPKPPTPPPHLSLCAPNHHRRAAAALHTTPCLPLRHYHPLRAAAKRRANARRLAIAQRCGGGMRAGQGRDMLYTCACAMMLIVQRFLFISRSRQPMLLVSLAHQRTFVSTHCSASCLFRVISSVSFCSLRPYLFIFSCFLLISRFFCSNQYVHRSLDVEGELSAPRAAPRCLQRHLALLEL